MLILKKLSYIFPNKDVLFSDISLTINRQEKISLIGKNGVGKSTLLKIITGDLQHLDGQYTVQAKPYYIPQIFGQFNHLSIAQALGVEQKLLAFQAILEGDASEDNYRLLDDDWTIESRCEEALAYWQLSDFDLNQSLASLSGGQKTRVLLAGMSIHQAELVLMDEPSNHLDLSGRQRLYEFIESTSSSLLIVSHDRTLLNLLDVTCEMKRDGIVSYGGNYDFYVQQKQIEQKALQHALQSKEKSLRKAKNKQRETLQRQNKLDARGRKKQIKSGVPKIVMNKMKNDAENSSSKLKHIHEKKMGSLSLELKDLREALPEIDNMTFGFEDSGLHRGKILFQAVDMNFRYDKEQIWEETLNIEICSGERIALKGLNGSGKTTFIRLMLGELEAGTGTIKRADFSSVYIDQDYSLIRNQKTVLEQAESFNDSVLKEHEIKTRLTRFLFPKEVWDKSCQALSGGERMRLMLCCLTINQQSPDLIVLDEPTNNLDIQNIEILTKAINAYQGTLIVVSHDQRFLEEIEIQRSIEL